MLDAVVQQRLREAGQTLDTSNMLYLRAEAVGNSPRVLDKPMAAMKIPSCPFDTTYGCCAEFISAYNTYKNSLRVEQAKINYNGTDKFCDVDIYYALYTLGMQGICCVDERSGACAKLFRMIVATEGDTITVSRVYNTLSSYKPATYFEKELLKAITVCLFNENAVVLEWLSLIEPRGFYEEAIQRGREYIQQSELNKRSLRTFLQENYSKATADKEFMKSLYKPACNKWLIGMIFFLKDKYPEVLEYSKTSQGFM